MKRVFFAQFEESYNAMLEGFKVVDFLGDAFISKVDFKQVLEEFGISCTSLELEGFFAQ